MATPYEKELEKRTGWSDMLVKKMGKAIMQGASEEGKQDSLEKVLTRLKAQYPSYINAMVSRKDGNGDTPLHGTDAWLSCDCDLSCVIVSLG